MSAMGLGQPNPGATAVPVYLPLTFIASGIAGFMLLALELAGVLPSSMVYVRHNAHLLVLVHLFTLIWGSGITMGVLHQMAPVILSAQLHSVRLGWLTLALFVPGGFLLALSFRSFWLTGVIIGGSFVILGALTFSYNMARTLAQASERSVTSRYLGAILTAFVSTLAAGITMAASLRFGAGYGVVQGFLMAHLFLGAAGWFTGVIIAVSYRLVPMFLLVHGHDETPAFRILAALYTGVALGVLGSFWRGLGVVPGVAIVLVAVLLWTRDVSKMWGKRSRRPDAWMRQVPFAVAYLIAAACGAATLAVAGKMGYAAPPRLLLAVGALFALGGVSTFILALLHKIVPFLVWYHRYSGVVGRERTPAMKDLTNEAVGRIAFVGYHASVVLIVAAVALGGVKVAQVASWAAAVAFALLAHDLVWLILPVKRMREGWRALCQKLQIG